LGAVFILEKKQKMFYFLTKATDNNGSICHQGGNVCRLRNQVGLSSQHREITTYIALINLCLIFRETTNLIKMYLVVTRLQVHVLFLNLHQKQSLAWSRKNNNLILWKGRVSSLILPFFIALVAEPLHSLDGEKRGGADAGKLGGAAGDAGR
jgi:hypothetical protein